MMNSSAYYKQERRSEEVNEVLSNMPSWMTRWGVLVFLLVIVCFIGAGWFVKLPDTIIGEIQLITQVPPVSLIARANGEINFLVQDNQRVTAGTRLAVIENTANTDDMFSIIDNLHRMDNDLLKPELDPQAFVHQSLNLGEVQPAYQGYHKAAQIYFGFLNSKYYQDQQFELQRELSYTREIIAHLQRSADKHKEFREASTKVNDPIFGEKAKVTGDPDFSEVSQEKLANDNMISIIQYKMKASQLTSRLTELEAEHLSKKRQLHIDLDENFKLLQNQVALWQSKYLLVAPLNGTVSLYKFWNDHQFVSAGEEVMTILPDDGTVMGRMVAPAMGAGKVEVGQAVMIKLYNFPHDEYGVIEGQVRSISTLARQKQYVIDVALTNGLHTSYGKDIEFKQEMAGRASVIVKDLRLFERLLKDFINF